MANCEHQCCVYGSTVVVATYMNAVMFTIKAAKILCALIMCCTRYVKAAANTDGPYYAYSHVFALL